MLPLPFATLPITNQFFKKVWCEVGKSGELESGGHKLNAVGIMWSDLTSPRPSLKLSIGNSLHGVPCQGIQVIPEVCGVNIIYPGSLWSGYCIPWQAVEWLWYTLALSGVANAYPGDVICNVGIYFRTPSWSQTWSQRIYSPISVYSLPSIKPAILVIHARVTHKGIGT